ncbi:DUF2243 domain-containing protein [Desertibacillus haloalkaliphilus]|uniref:DUF2243 domain-containing protein n=1 Tax=Desertibacillus haloalkaliphilus TaxID=1328930 RepID=UPI001C251773|nr:DUF2243 domain-containing protein [Desertibacillus haloalkaliphilus]MBU8906473.1 DUF2243 domain-containing protein [Desertibacillus haloalkaliphilus]
MANRKKKRLLAIGSFLLGFGFLGAMDGIIFHQLLQWHSVIMDTDRAGQIISDGIFHFATTVTLVVGGILLWLAGNPADLSRGVRLVIGGFLIGGGIFNLVEGIINHHILQIHRVRPAADHPLVYDLAFLASGAILLIVGIIIRRKGKEENTTVSA